MISEGQTFPNVIAFTEPTCPDDSKCGDPCMSDGECHKGYSCLQARNNPYVKMCCESKSITMVSYKATDPDVD